MRGDGSLDDILEATEEYVSFPSAGTRDIASAAWETLIRRVIQRWYIEQNSYFHGQSPRLKKDPTKPAEGRLLSVVRAPKVLRYVEIIPQGDD